MSKSRIHILVVEDDVSQGKALEAAFKRAGYSVVLCESSVNALSTAQRMEFQVLLVDCMLPKMNGVDLVEEILEILPHKPTVLLTSGIFKDRKFMQDSIKKTGAEQFFVKPLDVKALLELVDSLTEQEVEPERPPVLRLYGAEALKGDQLIQIMDQEPTLHAFHLIKLYQRIQQAKLTGELTLISAVGDMSSVSFFEGRVFAVKTPDKESFFGSLAISKGFVAPEDVLEALRDPTQKMLGQKLIDSMSLSPHAIQIILTEQLALRLSQTVQDDVVSLQWVNKKIPRPNDVLATSHFKSLQEDWLNSKITPDWVHSTLMVWGSFQLDGAYHNSIQGEQSVEKVLNSKEFDSSRDLVSLFASLIRGQAHLGTKVSDKPDFTFLESRLDRMTTDFKSQNYFQFLGVGEKAHQREISKSYESLKSTFDPQVISPECPPEIRDKASRVFSHIQLAYDTLSNEVERMRYLGHLQSKRAQEALEAEPIFRAAIIELQSGHPKEALTKFQSLLDRKMEFRDLRSYYLWAGLKCDRNFNGVRLDQIPPEERHSAAYMMAKGVHLRMLGQFKKSFEAFRTAHVLDPRMSIAKYELQKLAADLERSGTNRDMVREVTSIVEGLFGRGSRKGA